MLVDMVNTMQLFENAVRQGLALHKCPGRSNLVVTHDRPNEHDRFTYARVNQLTSPSDLELLGIAVFACTADEFGKVTFSVGYAVKEQYRRNGIGSALLQESIEELAAGVRKQGYKGIVVDIAADIDNIASQRLANKVLSVPGVLAIDDQTGKPIIVFKRHY